MAGIFAEVKLLVCLKRVGSAFSLWELDDTAQMGKGTIRSYWKLVLGHTKEIDGSSYLNRRSTRAELGSISSTYRDAGFLGCIGAVDGMKMHWENSTISQKGQYHSSKDGKLETIGIEAWCGHDLYVCSWFPGRGGRNNDRTLLSFNHLFIDILSGSFEIELPMTYKFVHVGRNRRLGYFLADDIYTQWEIFVRPIQDAPARPQMDQTKAQEGDRKDIERVFGGLARAFPCFSTSKRTFGYCGGGGIIGGVHNNT